MKNGILNDSQIKKLFNSQEVSSDVSFDKDQIQPASLDLRLGHTAWRVRASFLPNKNSKVKDKLKQFQLHKFDITEGAVLETGCVYIVKLLENIKLPKNISATTNPKSSTGRLDVFTRVIADNAGQFDVIPNGYKGPLYLEISPRTFPIIVRMKSRLSQIRFRKGSALFADGELQLSHKQEAENSAILSYAELLELHKREKLVDSEKPDISPHGVAISIDLIGDKKTGLIGYRGKRHTGVIDVDKKGRLNPKDFWEPIYKQRKKIVLDPDEFYILVSREAVCIPPETAAEMTPFDPLVGEFRVHYAGFFDPGFGHREAGGGGAKAVLEVRSYEVPFILEDGQIIGRLVYEHMLQIPETLYGKGQGSNYQKQGLKLSKHFK